MIAYTRSVLRLLALVMVLMALTACQTGTAYTSKWKTLNTEKPVIIAHRGDSGGYPEHTLAAYDSALNQFADYIELDIVLTKDSAPICRHDLYLSTTTDIATLPAFADRKGKTGQREDWFAIDLLLSEVMTLRAVQPVPGRPSARSLLHVPALAETVELVNRFNDTREKPAGLYIEIKQPGFYRASGRDPSRQVLDVLQRFRKAGVCPPVILQCFDRDEAERLAGMTNDPVFWLTSKPVDMNNLPRGIAGLGLSKDLIQIEEDPESRTARMSTLVDAAHERGLLVHVWTFRDDSLDATGYTDPGDEIEDYLRAGVDGVFTDFPETGVEALKAVELSWRKPLASSRARQNISTRIMD